MSSKSSVLTAILQDLKQRLSDGTTSGGNLRTDYSTGYEFAMSSFESGGDLAKLTWFAIDEAYKTKESAWWAIGCLEGIARAYSFIRELHSERFVRHFVVQIKDSLCVSNS